MAFPAAAGNGQFPNGAFSPVIYAKKAQLAFRKDSVVQAITNTDYQGEISSYGDTVKIIMEPEVTVSAYKRGQNLVAQELTDEEMSLTVDKANYFMFTVDDLEKKQSHQNWESLASNRAAYNLKQAFDTEILSYISGEIPTANVIGTNASPMGLGYATVGANHMRPLDALAQLSRMLDVNSVPNDSRWLVIDPYFKEVLEQEDSKLLNEDFVQDGSQLLRNGKVTDKEIRGFKLYKSLNLPTVGTGPTATSGSHYGWLIAGHMSAVSSAEQINKTESYRSQTSFGDVVRGLHMYGRKVLRQPSLVAIRWNKRTS